jgi:hypothetical protein
VVEATAGPSWGEQYPIEEWLAKATEPQNPKPQNPEEETE